MDFFSVLRMVGGLAVVLGILAGALWLVRRYDIKLPGRVGAARDQRLEIVERITIDQRRSLLLIRRDGQEQVAHGENSPRADAMSAGWRFL